MTREVIATINPAALRHNLQLIRQLAAGCSIWAMIKSNAYGHGLCEVADILSDVDMLGVACFAEAVQLRRQNIKTPIVVMSGFLTEKELQGYHHYDLSAVLHQAFQIKMLRQIQLDQPIPVWLKIDTGMHRLGFSLTEVTDVYAALQACCSVAHPIGLMTHLSSADSDPKLTWQQVQAFQMFTEAYDGPKSIANSAAILAHPVSYADVVRPGIMLYGVSPFVGKPGALQGLRPVMTLSARLIARNRIKKGEHIGYGASWRCPYDMDIGVVGVGYGDGYPRHAPSGTPMMIHGKICPLVGRVSMDMVTVDLSICQEAKVGDEVILWGDALPVEQIAEYATTIPYELLCSVTTSRVKYCYQ